MTDQSVGATLPEWILLLPVGQVELVDRPDPLQVDPESLAGMVRSFRSRGVDLVIDYEHQSLQGRQAPAAGWIKDLEARGDGLWARVEWTLQAQEYLRNREYRYFSPVLRLDPESRKPMALMQVGLTNVPAIKRLPPLVAKWTAPGPETQEPADPATTGGKEVATVETKAPENQQGRKGEDVEKLKLFLGLSPETEDQTVWAKALEVFQSLAATLKLPGEATASQLLAAVESLQRDGQRLSQVEDELGQLKSRLATEATAKAVEEALKAGKITPSQKSWALEYYRQDPDGFQTFVARAPQLVPTGIELKLRQGDVQASGNLIPEEVALCRSLNLAPEKYLQAKAQTARAH